LFDDEMIDEGNAMNGTCAPPTTTGPTLPTAHSLTIKQTLEKQFPGQIPYSAPVTTGSMITIKIRQNEEPHLSPTTKPYQHRQD
jgi:hypothetical protein